MKLHRLNLVVCIYRNNLVELNVIIKLRVPMSWFVVWKLDFTSLHYNAKSPACMRLIKFNCSTGFCVFDGIPSKKYIFWILHQHHQQQQHSSRLEKGRRRERERDRASWRSQREYNIKVDVKGSCSIGSQWWVIMMVIVKRSPALEARPGTGIGSCERSKVPGLGTTTTTGGLQISSVSQSLQGSSD